MFFYVLLFVGVLTRKPIKTEGPPGVLERAATGDATARFVVDTWTTLGLALGVIGAVLLFYSRQPLEARALEWTVVALELAWAIPIDIYKIARGYKRQLLAFWIVVHSAIGVTGVLALRAA